MPDAISLRLDGEIIAESPLATSPKDTPIGTPAPNPQARPPAPLPRMPKFIEGVGVEFVPYFPGAGIRGRLRRLGEEVVRYGIAGEEGASPFGIADEYYLRNGGLKGDERESKIDILAAAARRDQNPLVALFGAGAPWDRGRLRVGRASPAVPISVEVVRGARADDFARGGDAMTILSPEAQREWLAISQRTASASRDKQRLAELGRVKRREKDAERKSVIEREEAMLANEIRQREGESGRFVSVQLPLPGYEAIPTGTRLAHDFTLLSVRRYEVGLFLEILDRLALEPIIGAHSAHGCGVISGTWRVRIRAGPLARYEEVGEIRLKPFDAIELPGKLSAWRGEFKRLLEDGKFNFHAPSSD